MSKLTSVRDLLAVIHQDGGRYQQKHGLSKACKDAIDLVGDDRLHRDRAEMQIAQIVTILTAFEDGDLADPGGTIVKIKEVING